MGKAVVSPGNFDNIYSSMLVVFKVLTLDNWNDNMDDGMNATKQDFASLFFVAIIVLGSYIVLNLFLAILLENFGNTDEEEDGAGKQVEPNANATNSLPSATSESSE